MMATAIIPARGSSRLPRKNLLPLSGRPLLCWSIDTAHDAATIQRVVVTTDDEEIAEVALHADASVIMRPPELAEPEARSMEAVLHAAEEMGLSDDNVIAVLRPTSPLRSVEDIDRCVAPVVSEESPFNSAMAVCRARPHPYAMMEPGDEGLRPLLGTEGTEGAAIAFGRRRGLPPALAPNGAVYVARLGHLVSYRSYCVPPCYGHEMPQERSIDINTELDLRLAQLVMDQRLAAV